MPRSPSVLRLPSRGLAEGLEERAALGLTSRFAETLVSLAHTAAVHGRRTARLPAVIVSGPVAVSIVGVVGHGVPCPPIDPLGRRLTESGWLNSMKRGKPKLRLFGRDDEWTGGDVALAIGLVLGIGIALSAIWWDSLHSPQDS